MSLKAYDAWRLKEGVDPWDFIRHVRLTSYPKLKAYFTELMDQLMQGYANADEEKKKEIRKLYGLKEDKADLTNYDLSYWLYKKYKEASQSPYRGEPFDFDVELSIRKYEGRYYVMPHASGPLRHILSFLDEPNEWVEEYGYWDNTDKPEELTEEEWAERAAVWYPLSEYGREGVWPDVLVFEVMYQEALSSFTWEIMHENAANRADQAG